MEGTRPYKVAGSYYIFSDDPVRYSSYIIIPATQVVIERRPRIRTQIQRQRLGLLLAQQLHHWRLPGISVDGRCFPRRSGRDSGRRRTFINECKRSSY
jgi:hypothetical protein